MKKFYYLLLLLCWGGVTHAQRNYNLPENFYDIGRCNYQVEKFDFSIALRHESSVNVDNYVAMAAGNLDGDEAGTVEIVAMKPNNNSHHAAGSYLSNGFYIFNNDATVRHNITFPEGYIFSTNVNSITLANLDNNTEGKSKIILTTTGNIGGTNYRMYVYDHEGNRETFISSTTPFLNTTGIIDFDNDGYPEIYSGTNIYRYVNENGVKKLILLYEGNATQYAVAQDIDGDGIPEIVTPGKAYSVSLTNLTGTSGNTLTEISTCATAVGGVHALADVDLDGQIEVVSVVGGTNSLKMVIWNPLTGAVKYNPAVSIGSCSGTGGSSFPFIGDTDNNGYPDIAFMGGTGGVYGCTSVYRYQYNTATQKVEYVSKDDSFRDYSSRVTGLSMFDFNIDGRKEVVYRDELNLFILRGTDFYKEVTVPNNCSGTLREYPLIVSLDNSGESFILINSGLAINQVGTLRIYGANIKGGYEPWAPARKMWNQFAFYQNTMDENLNVIPNPAPLNYKMTSSDNTKTMYPFNGHMFQLGPIEKTTLDYLRPIPDINSKLLPDYYYDVENNKLRFELELNNTGDAAMTPPIPVHVYWYKDGVEQLIATPNIMDNLNVGDVKKFQLSVADFGQYIPHDSIVIKIPISTEKPDCNPDNNIIKIETFYDVNCDDYYGMYNNGSGAKATFDILVNDKVAYPYISDVSNVYSTAGSTVTINSSGLVEYTSPAGFSGIDTLHYSAIGQSQSQQMVYAKAFVYVYKTWVHECYEKPVTYQFDINDTKNDVTVRFSPNSHTVNAPGSTSVNTTVTVTFNASGTPVSAFNNTITSPYEFELVPQVMRWKVQAVDNNWNNPSNWEQNTVPLSCSDVFIPGNSTKYPSLDAITTPRIKYGDPICNNITFHFGGEVARPHLLTYNKAYINYNFGYFVGNQFITNYDSYSATAMRRNRWYALAAPLKKMVSGDFSLGGYPNTWQQGFKTSTEHNGDLVGNWYVPDNNNARELGANQNYAITLCVGGYDPKSIGEADHKNLNGLFGIFDIPYFESATRLLHTIHARENGICKFWYYSRETLDIVYDSLPGTITRGDEAYRFVFEDNNNKAQSSFKVTVPAGDIVMVGNPFVSSLDFDAFYEANKASLSSTKYYKLYEDGYFQTYYAIGNNPMTYIAPLQAFFIETVGTGTVDLYFNEEFSVARSGSLQLRNSEQSSKNVLPVQAISEDGSSEMLLVSSSSEESNVIRLFSDDYEGAVPQIYTMDYRGMKNDVQFESYYDSEITLGVKSSGNKEIELVFDTENTNFSSLVLYDKHLDKKQDLFKNNKYSFLNLPTLSSDRFTLAVGNFATNIDDLREVKVHAYVTGKQLHVNANEVISEVNVFDIRGVNVMSVTNDSRHFSREINSVQGVYLVKITLANGEILTEKVILK